MLIIINYTVTLTVCCTPFSLSLALFYLASAEKGKWRQCMMLASVHMLKLLQGGWEGTPPSLLQDWAGG